VCFTRSAISAAIASLMRRISSPSQTATRESQAVHSGRISHKCVANNSIAVAAISGRGAILIQAFTLTVFVNLLALIAGEVALAATLSARSARHHRVSYPKVRHWYGADQRLGSHFRCGHGEAAPTRVIHDR